METPDRLVGDLGRATQESAESWDCMTAPALTRQQLCAALTVSESTVRRLELDGMPYTPIGVRGKRYDLDECKNWLRETKWLAGSTNRDAGTSRPWSTAKEFTASCRRVQLRVMPSD